MKKQVVKKESDGKNKKENKYTEREKNTGKTTEKK
jgi:hypothetical protein